MTSLMVDAEEEVVMVHMISKIKIPSKERNLLKESSKRRTEIIIAI